jgi:hypothetical protein
VPVHDCTFMLERLLVQILGFSDRGRRHQAMRMRPRLLRPQVVGKMLVLLEPETRPTILELEVRLLLILKTPPHS